MPITMIARLAAAMPLAQERSYNWTWEMHPMWWMWGFGGVVMMLGMLIFWAVIITAIVIAVRWLVRDGRGERPDNALQILRERYARGEINRDEFEARKQDLR